jgi:hypothetical protein
MDERKTTPPPQPNFVTLTSSIYVCLLLTAQQISLIHVQENRSQLPRDRRHEPAAARLLGLRVQIPLGTCMSLVSVVSSGSGLCLGLNTRTEESYECDTSECDREASIMRKPWATRGLLRHGWTYRRMLHVSAISYNRPHGLLCYLLVINSRTSTARRCRISSSI